MIFEAQILMSAAYLFFFYAAFPNLIAAYKNRKHLRGFSKYGVTATAIGLTGCQAALFMDGAYVPVFTGMLNWFYWVFLTSCLWIYGGS